MQHSSDTGRNTAPQKHGHLVGPLNLVVLAIMISVFIYGCLHYEITQDDAFISFRYAANFMNGDGLVYNPGEHVEGYTNFFWIIILIFLKQIFGIDLVLSAKILGVLFGSAIFAMIFWMIRDYPRRERLFILIAAGIMLLFNIPLAYWSISGLETAAFSFALFAALLTELRRPTFTPFPLVIATLLRPEGALVFLIVIVNRLVRHHPLSFRFFAYYILPLVPWAVFKLIYYGSLLPNPFYAKSGVGLEYIRSGLSYLWFFTSTIGVYGLVFLIPLLAIKWLWKQYSLLYLFVLTYVGYIVGVGGDVLKVYRFFVPIIPVLAFLVAVSAMTLAKKISIPASYRFGTGIVTLMLSLILGASGFIFSKNHIATYRLLEVGLVEKMGFTAKILSRNMSEGFSIAASTIGKLGYDLPRRRVIDILGLTDSYIARNPEKVPGLHSTWSERRFNCSYLLKQQPDIIIFSTNDKPSAPAELALFLHSEFRRNYDLVGIPRDNKDHWSLVYVRRGNIDMAHDSVLPNIDFANYLKIGYDFRFNRDYVKALRAYKAASRYIGDEYPLLLINIGEVFFRQRYDDSARYYIDRVLKIDPGNWKAHYIQSKLTFNQGDTLAAYDLWQALMQPSLWLPNKSR